MDDLLRAQKRLGQTLERASIGEDRELAQAVREKGEAFANLFYSTLRMTRVYDIANESFKRPVGELNALLRWMLTHLGVVHVVTVEDQIYVNDVRIRFRMADSPTPKLGGELRAHNIGGVTFHVELPDDRLLVLLAALGGDPAPEGKRAAVCRTLAEADVVGVELSGVNRFLQAGEEKFETEWTEVLGRAVELVEETWSNVAAGRMLNPLSLRRMVVELLSAGIETDGLWQPPAGETRHGPHAVRVCLVSLLVGTGVELSDKLLQDLGIAALVHDIGYTTCPPGAERSSLKQHLGGGARVMLAQRGFHEAKIHRILGLLYHHHNHRNLADTPSLFGRILRVAEDYDNLCGPGRGQYAPPVALGAMATASGSYYDPTLFQVLVNRIGRYPPWTRVTLADGRRGTVLSPARGPNHDRPTVVTADGQLVDLAEGGSITAVEGD